MNSPQSHAHYDVARRTAESVLKPRVLVVEDVEDTRRHLAEILRNNHYYVVEAADGLEALKKISEARFDAILLDLVLPHVDGWQFRQTMLRHPELAGIPTIAVTVKMLRDVDRYVLRMADVIHKPFTDDTLLGVVAKACATVRAVIPAQTEAPEGTLFWSKRGEIACAEHAPVADPQRWHAERWVKIPKGAGKGRIAYQCQHCPGHAGPIARGKASHS